MLSGSSGYIYFTQKLTNVISKVDYKFPGLIINKSPYVHKPLQEYILQTNH